MIFNLPTVIHKYDVADLTKYYYWQLNFQQTGVWVINGNSMTGYAGSIIDLDITSIPEYTSGSDELYLLGASLDCVCGDFPPAYTGTTSNDYPVNTPYYRGNFGNGRNGSDGSNDGGDGNVYSGDTVTPRGGLPQ